MSGLTPVGDYIEALIHASAQEDALTAARHRIFIAPRLVGAAIALAISPGYLIWRGTPSTLEILILTWLVLPILVAYFLSQTGRYELAHGLAALALTGLITIAATQSGGIGSFAAPWLVVVPLEAALSGSRRVLACASGLALAAAGLLFALSIVAAIPISAVGHAAVTRLAAAGIVSAILYAAAVAFGAQWLLRKSTGLLHAEEDRYRLLACNMTDAVMRHGRHGAVLFASPAAERLFGVPARQLLGHGLFDRIHVADRPAYLKTLSDSATGGEAQSIAFRVKQGAIGNAAFEGTFTWVEMQCQPREPSERRLPGDSPEIIASIRDIGLRKALEQALENARAEIRPVTPVSGRGLHAETLAEPVRRIA